MISSFGKRTKISLYKNVSTQETLYVCIRTRPQEVLQPSLSSSREGHRQRRSNDIREDIPCAKEIMFRIEGIWDKSTPKDALKREVIVCLEMGVIDYRDEGWTSGIVLSSRVGKMIFSPDLRRILVLLNYGTKHYYHNHH